MKYFLLFYKQIRRYIKKYNYHLNLSQNIEYHQKVYEIIAHYIETYKKLAPKIDVQFVKVKAHSGVEFNELADQLAKDANKNAPSDS